MTLRRFSSLRERLDHAFLRDRLKVAKSYKRIAGYFRSSIFELVGEEIAGIPDVRIVCNSELDAADLKVAKAAREANLKERWNQAPVEVEALLERERYRKLWELLRAGNAAEAARRIEAIASWRRQPAPLAWKVETEYRVSGLAAAWPLLAELSWLAPPRAATLAARLQDPELNGLLSRFDAQFEGDGEAEDFAWFPAWTLIAEPGWANVMRLAQHGAGTPAERCAWQMFNLLLLERQGRHADIIDGRRKLRAAHPRLFELYMRSR